MDNISYFISLFPRFIGDILNSIDKSVKSQINEIRLRKNKPIVIYVLNTLYFIEHSGMLTRTVSDRCINISEDDFEYICDKLCSHSYHTNMSSLIDGYVTAKNGSRIGVSSTAVFKDDKIHSVKDISSLNIRISHECINCAKKIIDLTYRNKMPSIIVAGLPGCGKTTFLRDYARLISNGYSGEYKKVSIIDERKEIAAGFDVGINTDVLSGFIKSKGIEIATRTLSPDLIVCDEIGSVDELEKIRYSFSTGVSFAVSIHLKNAEDIFSNIITDELINTGQFDFIVILKSFTDEFEIIDLGEIKLESGRNDNDNPFFILPWFNGG